VRLVLLPSSVTTRRGKPVRSLQREDFRLFEEGEPRDVELFATESEVPIALAFVLDLSGSMGLGGRLDQARSAIRRWTAALAQGDRAALIGFADGKVDWVAGFDEDRSVLLERLEALRPGGRTALYDALAAAPLLVDEGVHGRKAIVLLTDGVDNASVMSRLQATWNARRVRVPVYAVGFIPMEERLMTQRALEALRLVEQFAEETGGTLLAVHDAEGLEAAARHIQDELRFQYVIGFHSAAHRDGSFRRVRLETVDRDLRVRTRSGYYADP
jgi:Ca-activated chloride channel family protein